MKKKKSNFTHRQSQVATAGEVITALIAAIIFWFIGWQIAAVGLLVVACISLLAHATRKFKDD